MLQQRWQSWILLLSFTLSNISGHSSSSVAASASAPAKDLCSRGKISGNRALLSFVSLADAPSSSGLVFCVASPTADPAALSSGLSWACGPGAANCTAIQPGQACYVANNLTALASYAYNDYYQRTRLTGGTCSFNHTAVTTTTDPSYGLCVFTGSSRSSTSTNTNTSPSPTSTPTGTFTPGSGDLVPFNNAASLALFLAHPVVCILAAICQYFLYNL